jgi:hypothetical protein
MTKYTLIAEHTSLFTGAPVSKSTHEFEADGLMDVVENVELFLKGAGFVFDGYLDIVPPDEESPEFQTPNADTITLSTGGAGSTVTVGGAGNIHSQYYFDTERNK